MHALHEACALLTIAAWEQAHVAEKLLVPSHFVIFDSFLFSSFSNLFLPFLFGCSLPFVFLHLVSFLFLSFPILLLPSSSCTDFLTSPFLPAFASPLLLHFPLCAPVRPIHRDPW